MIDSVNVRFVRLRLLEDWIIELNQEFDFPFPQKLQFYHWRQLLSYDHHFAMTHYLIAILEGKEMNEKLLRKLRELDETTATQLTMPPGQRVVSVLTQDQLTKS